MKNNISLICICIFMCTFSFLKSQVKPQINNRLTLYKLPASDVNNINERTLSLMEVHIDIPEKLNFYHIISLEYFGTLKKESFLSDDFFQRLYVSTTAKRTLTIDGKSITYPSVRVIVADTLSQLIGIGELNYFYYKKSYKETSFSLEQFVISQLDSLKINYLFSIRDLDMRIITGKTIDNQLYFFDVSKKNDITEFIIYTLEEFLDSPYAEKLK